LATRESNEQPVFSGWNEAAQFKNTDFKIFGKPSTRAYRRMAVALAYGHEDVKELVEKAKEVARKISVK
jgi:phosphoribosylglycinamide formyltransferase 2